ncbi:uncharacterized protein LOC106674133 [Cimex lectularius]|uniref:Uncharacterized protein n=1 Tax=Cimex lectularius TaxID=79782 RepID=A0A8I6SBS6_CIMLE|nr:uncharacterized protein LOC106674133 [Cimex lectularius]
MWQRSASAKELRKPCLQTSQDSFIEPIIPPRSRNFAIAGSKTPSFDRDAETKVYSSSYPGTTSSLSTESADELEPGGSILVIDTGSSRDDLSHDSYELLERDSRNYSRSCSIGSSGPENQDDELFTMDDYRDFDDVDKRLGYVEPRYRNVGFNEFNELCKRGFASKRSSQPVEFNEFEAKCIPGAVIRHDVPEERYPVERTKSEPYVSDFWKVAREHRKLFHQKSFDYTPSESMDSDGSKSTADIPYTLHKRQQMNGTSSGFECGSPVSPNKSEEKPVSFERKSSLKSGERFAKTKHDSDLNSQDSGLSLSLGAESTDDLEESKNTTTLPEKKSTSTGTTLKVKKDLLKVSSEDGPQHKSLLAKTKAVSADSGLKRVFSFERPPPVEVIKIPSQDGEGIVICSSDSKNFSLDTSDPDVIIVEYHTKRKRAFQKRSSSGSVEKEKRGSSFEIIREDKNKKERHKEWRSESKSSYDIQDKTDFKRERFSKEVKTSIEGKVVRESLEEKELKKQKSEELYRQKTEELRKQRSEDLQRQTSEELQRQKSEEMQKKILRRQEVIEQLRQKHEDLNKIEIIKTNRENEKKSKTMQKPSVQKQDNVFKELSPKSIQKHDKVVMEVPVEINATEKQLGYCRCEHKDSIEIEKMEDINEEKDSVFEDDSTKEDTPLQVTDNEEKQIDLKEPEEVKEESKPEPDLKEESKPEPDKKEESKPEPEVKEESIPELDVTANVIVKEVAKISPKKEISEPEIVTTTSTKPSQFQENTESDIKKRTVVEEKAKAVVSPEMVWKKFGDLPPITNKRERSPVLFARLGFSEGSAFIPAKAQSPASSRRAKSLDAPVVSLHRLPPITSFSSKDDTLDNEEGVELEEKTLRTTKPISVIEEEDAANLSPLIQDSNHYMTTIQEPDLTQMLPEIATEDPAKEENALFETLEPTLLQSYSVEPLPYTMIYNNHEGEQELPDVTQFGPDYRVKICSQLSDEQKVPEFPDFQTNDYDEVCEEVQEEEEEDIFNNDVFDSRTLEYSSEATNIPQPELGNDYKQAATEVDELEEVFDSTVNEEPQPERRPSTRQERLDSFKNTKSYSVDIWTSEENEPPGIPTVDVEDVDWCDDDTFVPDPIDAMMEHLSPKKKEFPITTNEINPNDIPIDLIPELPTIDVKETLEDSQHDSNADIASLSELCEKIIEPPPELKLIPPKRSFDEDVSSSSSFKPDKTTLKPFSLESSGSSSLEEGIFPPDDCSHFADEEEGSSNSAKDEYQGFGYSVAGAELVIGGYTGGVFGLSRTLSRISERSTTSEQDRSDFDDDLSTKPSSRSLSLEDESLMSSDRQPSLSSDPSINPEVEEQPLPPLPPEPLGFKIPPPLLQHDEEWPSPPNSSFDTPIVGSVETYYMNIRPEEPTKVILPKEPYDNDYSSDSDYENKTLQDDDGPDSSTKESTVKLALKHKKPGNSSDTSLGISDFSSSTGTVKHCQYYSCTVKSDDSSLADFGSSLSTEMLSSSRKNSDDSMCLRRRSFHHIQRRSFDDYDSPYSESDESCPKQTKRTYSNLPSPTTPCGKKLNKERQCAKSNQLERRNVCSKSIARSKCYSYYSLARSPPSDGSSSSLEMGEPPSTPNTIPRVSKRRRHVPPSKRRQRVSAETDIRDGQLISVSSPSVACVKRNTRDRSQMSKQSSV